MRDDVGTGFPTSVLHLTTELDARSLVNTVWRGRRQSWMRPYPYTFWLENCRRSPSSEHCQRHGLKKKKKL